VFLCPHCRGGYICITLANPLDGGAPFEIGTDRSRPIRRLWTLLYGDLEDPAVKGAVLPKGTWVIPPGFLWRRAGETFETLTLSPSVDASRAGCWHGFIRNGEAR
jgi:hypothetical protein